MRLPQALVAIADNPTNTVIRREAWPANQWVGIVTNWNGNIPGPVGPSYQLEPFYVIHKSDGVISPWDIQPSDVVGFDDWSIVTKPLRKLIVEVEESLSHGGSESALNVVNMQVINSDTHAPSVAAHSTYNINSDRGDYDYKTTIKIDNAGISGAHVSPETTTYNQPADNHHLEPSPSPCDSSSTSSCSE